MNQARKRPMHQKVLSMILVLVMLLGLLSMSAFTMADTQASADAADESYKYNIMFLDCGRKYYSVDSIEKIIDNASAAGFNYIQLAVGNDGLRFLLDDMSLTVGDQTYKSDAVKAAIQKGNTDYNDTFENNVSKDTGKAYPYNPTTNELTQSEMDTIIAYAASKGMGVIPCVNTPGHMDAILSAANSLTDVTCSYNGSARTIDVTNTTAVAFTQALLQKYINYFAGKGCQLFNMGADEYANDIYTDGSMGFGNLQSNGKYNYYVTYVNKVASMIKAAGMTPMAFNDGIYFANNMDSGTFDTDIIICYWSSGWNSYSPMSASDLADKGFQLINTNGSYYWVLGKSDSQCSATKASNFDKTAFPGSTVNNPAGSMFCIWADYPGAETEANVISKTADTIAAFGKTLPPLGIKSSSGSTALTLDASTQLTIPGSTAATWTVDPAGVIELQSPTNTEGDTITGTSVVAKAVGIGTATVTAKVGDTTYTTTLTVSDLPTKEITVAVGGTKTETVDGNYAGTYETENPAIATVATKSTAASEKKLEAVTTIESGKQYLIVHKRSGWVLNDATSDTGILLQEDKSKENSNQLWTITKAGTSNNTYTVKGVNGNFITSIGSNSAKLGTSSSNLKLSYNSNSGDGYWDIYYGTGKNASYLNQYGNAGSTKAAGYSASGATDDGSQWEIYKVTPETKAQTTITFTGEAEGTTSVTIGGVKYNIHVVSKELADVTPLTVEYWITNKQVKADGAISKNILATDASVYSETGAKFSDLVPPTGVENIDNTKNDVFWKGVRLTSDNKQTSEAGVDKTLSGDNFSYIRYWNQTWSFSADGTNWTAFNADDQVVAYYLQKTDVTNEVTTEVVDWGEPQEKYTGYNYVIVDYAVKYQSGGNRQPNSFPVEGKTLGFHCDSSDTNTVHTDSSGNLYRSIGMIKAEATENYEVYMITLTPSNKLNGYQCSSNKEITYYTTEAAAADATITSQEKVVWVDDEANLGEFADPSTHFTSISGNIKYTVGGEPIVPGLEIYNKYGMLVTYYVREKETADSLHVHYIDATSGSGNEFYSYPINVHQGTYFDANIGLNRQSWKGPLKNGTVKNIADKEQTVSADLSTMPAIGANYKYSKYTCTRVERSQDGKDVYLYYTFNNKVSYVVDFGLPLDIHLSDLNASLATANVTSVKVEGAKYGTATYANRVVTYTPTMAISAIDTLSVTVSGVITYTDDDGNEVTKQDTVSYMVDIIPATNVYYEDSFATFTNCDGTPGVSSTDKGKGYWVTDGTTNSDAKQALDELGAQTKNVYGYDPAYQNCNQFSMGSATKVTVDANTAEDGNWPTATFTFKGTGFDVISLTDNTSGAISVKVYSVADDGTEKQVKGTLVNNYYGYTYDSQNKTWNVDTTGGNNALYQIPVITISGLTYGTYKAVITVSYAKYADVAQKGQYNFWLDAIRVYDPMGKDNQTYTQDGEGYPQYIKLRDSLAKDKTATANRTVFIDGAAEADVALYSNYGPNNEVYLTNGQAITFRVSANTNIAAIQIGAKAPNGQANLVVNGTELETLSSATEMYYDITSAANGKQVTISNTSSNILSLTNLKITFKMSDTVTLAELTDTEQANAVAQVRTLFAVPAAEPFQPDRFDASWSRNVRKGDTATLTVKASEDVAAITVNGETIGSYVERPERTGWGWWAKTVTYREFTYTTTADVTTDYAVCAVNSEGVSSDPITATLTVRTSVRDWLHGIIGKWF